MSDLTVLDVLLHNRRIGTLTRLPGDKVLFAFSEDYLDDRERPTLSLSFRDPFGELITDVRPTQTRLPAFFSNLLPEGRLRDYLAELAQIDAAREFFLIRALGRDLPGALRIVSADGVDPPRDREAAGRRNSPRRQAGGSLHFSLAGVQLKFSAVKEASGGLTIPAEGVGGSWIVKLPSTVHAQVPENEFAMMELARRVEIDVPETALVPLTKIGNLPAGIDAAGSQAFAIRRFDRRATGAVHMEDFAQVFGVYPERKYQKASYRSIARVLWIETGETGIAEFIRRLVFTALIGNGDMHLKNWSLLYPDRHHATLSPAYDFVSTVAYIKGDRLALNFTGSKDFDSLTAEAFVRFAAKAELPEKLVLDTARATVARFHDAWRHRRDLVPPAVEKAITAHSKTLPLWRM